MTFSVAFCSKAVSFFVDLLCNGLFCGGLYKDFVRLSDCVFVVCFSDFSLFVKLIKFTKSVEFKSRDNISELIRLSNSLNQLNLNHVIILVN